MERPRDPAKQRRRPHPPLPFDSGSFLLLIQGAARTTSWVLRFNFSSFALASTRAHRALEHILTIARACCVRCTGSEAERRSALLVYGALTIPLAPACQCAAMGRSQGVLGPKPVK